MAILITFPGQTVHSVHSADEQGVEVFYNVGVTPWCHITPDIQVVVPSRERVPTPLVFGLRAKVDF
jgi:porin